jgi:hypothetical protein
MNVISCTYPLLKEGAIKSHSLLFYRYVYNVKYQCFKKKMKKSRNFPSGQRGGGSRGVNSCNASVVLRNN